MWIFIWVLISVFVLGVFFWSVQILQQQKKAWAAYANKMGLAYESPSFMAPPLVRGFINDYEVNLTTDVQQTNDVRGQRYVTGIEVNMGAGMPTAAAIGTQELEPFINSLTMKEDYKPDFKEWDESFIIRTREKAVIKDYLTDERLKILKTFFSMSNSAVLFFFDEEDCVLRIETSDPMRDVAHLEKIMNNIIKKAEKLFLSEAEKKATKKKKPKKPKKEEEPQPEDETAETEETSDEEAHDDPDSAEE